MGEVRLWNLEEAWHTVRWRLDISAGEGCRGLSSKLASAPVGGVVGSELCFSLYLAHYPWQLRSDPAAPFPHLLPGPGTNLCGGQAGEPEPEESGDQRGEGGAAAFRYKPRGCQGASLVPRQPSSHG